MAKHAKLGRVSSHRMAMFRSIVTSLLEHEKIETTQARATEVKSFAEKMITLAKRGDLHAKRQVMAFVMNEDVVKKLFETIAPRYTDRAGGYTRTYKLDQRRGDAAPMVRIELV
ncbi:MAG: 50S ribosomal protein L17 [Bacillota bacterium]